MAKSMNTTEEVDNGNVNEDAKDAVRKRRQRSCELASSRLLAAANRQEYYENVILLPWLNSMTLSSKSFLITSDS